MTKKNEIIKAGILSTLIVGTILAVGGLSIIPTQEQHVYAVGHPTGGGGHGVGSFGASGGTGGMGGDAGTGTSGGTCTTPNCNANGVSQNGAPGTAGIPGTGTGLPGMLSLTASYGGHRR